MAKKTKWTCGIRVWLESNGQAALGRGRVELLEAIDRHRSIRRAAASLDMSYRRAWLLVKSFNSAGDSVMVEATKGGKTGGGAVLTPFGKEAIRQFYTLDRALRST